MIFKFALVATIIVGLIGLVSSLVAAGKMLREERSALNISIFLVGCASGLMGLLVMATVLMR